MGKKKDINIKYELDKAFTEGKHELHPEELPFSRALIKINKEKKKRKLTENEEFSVKINVVILQDHYEETRNPLFVWEAIKTSLEADLKLEKWIREYLLETSEKLMKLTNRNEQSDKKVASEIADALGMIKIGPGNAFKRYDLYQEHQKIIDLMNEEFLKEENFDEEKYPGNVTHCMKKVARELNKSFATVRKVYYEWAREIGMSEIKIRKR